MQVCYTPHISHSHSENSQILLEPEIYTATKLLIFYLYIVLEINHRVGPRLVHCHVLMSCHVEALFDDEDEDGKLFPEVRTTNFPVLLQV